MRFTQFLPLVTLASGFIIVDEDLFQTIEKSGKHILDTSQNVLDDALGEATDAVKSVGDNVYHKIHHAGCDIESWLEGSPYADDSFEDFKEEPNPPHRRPPHRKPPPKGKPRHPPHHQKPNLTVYELINESKYTTRLAKLINEYDDLVETLNSTKANYTVFAPTDAAFEKIPEHGKKPSKEFIKDLLLYHVSDKAYLARDVLQSYTIPTLYEPDKLGHGQRLTVRVTFKGPTINFYSRIVAVNIFGTNGVIHGIDSILVPPPRVIDIIDLLPGEFSTLELALTKTGLLEKMNDTDYPHEGGTFFAPSNSAFKKLGPRLNAFLFSKYGEKYLRWLLEYHIVVNQTFYSDAFYDASSDDMHTDRPPSFHFDLPTMLHGRPLAVDVARYGPFISIRINGFSRVTVHDGVASDGVIQVVSDVLVPPKKAGEHDINWKGEEMGVEEFKERIDPYLDQEENLEL
ncbi:FAS1 domain-containing protein [Zopfia rhizophila CBS 207.26]|uniref:FAS1 domain-containing protein n=1 Tax=Zopfia rhizophila CBS 207.26 TaxID=1314779 RepID=A0A6A6DG46_9PEZI|nr:FAS1 domain-containing protein [Zopfia rhizophila CBS 207.26]